MNFWNGPKADMETQADGFWTLHDIAWSRDLKDFSRRLVQFPCSVFGLRRKVSPWLPIPDFHAVR